MNKLISSLILVSLLTITNNVSVQAAMEGQRANQMSLQQPVSRVYPDVLVWGAVRNGSLAVGMSQPEFASLVKSGNLGQLSFTSRIQTAYNRQYGSTQYVIYSVVGADVELTFNQGQLINIHESLHYNETKTPQILKFLDSIFGHGTTSVDLNGYTWKLNGQNIAITMSDYNQLVTIDLVPQF